MCARVFAITESYMPHYLIFIPSFISLTALLSVKLVWKYLHHLPKVMRDAFDLPFPEVVHCIPSCLCVWVLPPEKISAQVSSCFLHENCANKLLNYTYMKIYWRFRCYWPPFYPHVKKWFILCFVRHQWVLVNWIYCWLVVYFGSSPVKKNTVVRPNEQ